MYALSFKIMKNSIPKMIVFFKLNVLVIFFY